MEEHARGDILRTELVDEFGQFVGLRSYVIPFCLYCLFDGNQLLSAKDVRYAPPEVAQLNPQFARKICGYR